MENERIAVELEHHRNEIGSLKHRMESVEKRQDTLDELVGTVRELVIEMRHMTEEQRKQGKRLDKLEAAPAERTRYWVRYVVGAAVTVVIGAVVGFALAHLGLG